MSSPIQLVIQADCRTFTPAEIGQCDAMITDPPYSAEVHSRAVSVRSGATRPREFGFDHLSTDLRAWVAQAAAQVKRWSVIYSDIESTGSLRMDAVAAGATYIRTLAWIRWSMPQLSGDRPPSGREDLLIFHRAAVEAGLESGADPVTDLLLLYGSKTGRKAWNGPGNLTHLQHKCLRGSGKHKAEKPLDQALDLVEWFTDPGETVFDPFAGSGSIGLACRLLERNYVGFEMDPRWAQAASERIANPKLSERDTERLARWTASRGL